MFVIWESVLLTDWSAPSSKVLSRLHDTRAAQFWDRRLLLSREIKTAARGGSRGPLAQVSSNDGPVWDVVAVYAKGARWDSAFPEPVFADRPVVQVMEEFRRHLQDALKD